MIFSIRHLTLVEVSIAIELEILSMILAGALIVTFQLVDSYVARHKQADIRIGIERLLRKLRVAGADKDVTAEFIVS